ncbi:hypothetical protein [Bacillus subtilis]|uniref:hypothetical protein n=1 Tax=Bacillus subtilis TaxID=1423 RepID=UPI002E248E21|nr:hypothetical protein [Bacillus subtilis]
MKKIKKSTEDFSDFKPLIHFMRRGEIPLLHHYEKNNLNFEYGFFLGLDVVMPLYKVLDFPAQDLKTAWGNTQTYINDALEILEEQYFEEIDKDNITIDVDREQISYIIDKLENIPARCYPIYLITTGTGDNERLVYVGKTSSENHRFAGGHLAALKLNDPKYDGLEKNLYFGCLTFLDVHKKHVPLEWISPFDYCKELLESVEASLIYHFQPELNTEHTKRHNSKIPIHLMIENWTRKTKFLHYTQIDS